MPWRAGSTPGIDATGSTLITVHFPSECSQEGQSPSGQLYAFSSLTDTWRSPSSYLNPTHRAPFWDALSLAESGPFWLPHLHPELQVPGMSTTPTWSPGLPSYSSTPPDSLPTAPHWGLFPFVSKLCNPCTNSCFMRDILSLSPLHKGTVQAQKVNLLRSHSP